MNKRMFACFIAVLLALALCFPVHAAVTTATFGDQNSSGEYRVTADSDGVITFASDTGLKFPYQAGTTSDTLTAAESGKTIISTATTGSPHFTLPAAAVGMEFTFVAATAFPITIDPDGTDIIKLGTVSAGDRIVSAGAAGNSITLFCGVANQWVVKAQSGTWSDIN